MKNSTDKDIVDKNLTLIASLWIETTVVIILCTSLASIVSQFIWGTRIGVIIAILWLIYKCKKESLKLKSLSYKQGGWMIWTIIIGCFISLIVQPHCFLDSYSYRIPQMMFWIQEGHPWSVPNVDMRINQMPHVWPMLSASFYTFLGEKGIALPNFISLLLFIWLLKDTARIAGIKDQLVNYVVAIFIAAPVVVMGASTNDNVITCTTFLFLSYFFACRTETTPKNISLSAISFALACGIKPQYLTLAPLWVGWFFIYETKPYKQLKFTHYAILIPLAIICSPIPTMAVNEFIYGRFNLPYVIDITTTVSTEEKIASSGSFIGSLVKLIKSHLDIPVNPFYKELNFLLSKYSLERFSFNPLIIPESAGLGIIAFMAIILGSIKKRKICLDKAILFIFAICGLLIATHITQAGTIGRSFIGFFWLTLPFVFSGLAQLSKKFTIWLACFSLFVGITCIILDPSAPLWPAKIVASKINYPTIKTQLEDYAHYSKRQYGPKKLLKHIPPKTKKIGIIISTGNPLAELWFNEINLEKILPLGENTTKKHLLENDIEYLIIMNNRLKEQNRDVFLNQLGAEIIATYEYTTYMQKGPEPWFLCKVKE